MIGQTHATAAQGEHRKTDALALLEARREVYVLRGRRALLTALCYRGYATADDVRNAVELPDGIDPKLLGVVPGPLARVGIIEPDGFKKSRRAKAMRGRCRSGDWPTASPRSSGLPLTPTDWTQRRQPMPVREQRYSIWRPRRE